MKIYCLYRQDISDSPSSHQELKHWPIWSFSDLKQDIENNNFSLSKEDFGRFFWSNDFFQENVWNCWFLATFDTFMRIQQYEYLIRSSVTKKGDVFTFTLPLGSWKNGTQILVDVWKDGDSLSQIDTKGTIRTPIRWWGDWVKALMIAIWKYITGRLDENQKNFDFNAIHWWYEWTVMPLLYNSVSSYSIDFQQKDSFDKILQKLTLVENMITITFWMDKNGKILSHDLLKQDDSHAFSIKRINKSNTGKVESLTITNPWHPKEEETYPIDFIRKHFLRISFSSTYDNLPYPKLGERELLNYNSYSNKYLEPNTQDSIGTIIKRTWDQYPDLSGGKFVELWTNARWDEIGYIQAYDAPRDLIFHSFWDNPVVQIKWMKSSVTFTWNKKEQTIFAQRFGVLLAKIRYLTSSIPIDFRKNEIEDSFLLDSKWNLVFRGWNKSIYQKAMTLESWLPRINKIPDIVMKILSDWLNSIGDKTILTNWSYFGNPENIPAMVRMMNEMYRSWF